MKDCWIIDRSASEETIGQHFSMRVKGEGVVSTFCVNTDTFCLNRKMNNKSDYMRQKGMRKMIYKRKWVDIQNERTNLERRKDDRV